MSEENTAENTESTETGTTSTRPERLTLCAL